MIGDLGRQVPNALSISRMLIGLTFPFISKKWWVSLIIVALTSEYLDGAVSRKYHWESDLGQLLDPIADKIFFVGVALTLVMHDRLHVGHAFLLATRDVMVVLATLWISFRKGCSPKFALMKPLTLGKGTTILQYACLGYLCITPKLPAVAVAITAGLGAIAGIQYLYVFPSKGFSTDSEPK